VEGSAYDRNSKSLIFKTNHFSVYGLGYESSATKLTDTSGNWAKDSIDYVVNRGLISGSSETVFAPEQAITRGVLATALSKLAGVDMKAVVQGKGNNQFTPEQAVTREEVAVILADYAKATGYQLPQVRIAYAFSDGAKIENGYQEAVAAMQKAGVIIGKEGSNFSPKANASRAEVSSMLHRYIKLTINPITTQNWAKNDSGQYMYFKEGKAVTDWQTIDGVRYYFESSGILKTSWVKDGQIWRYYDRNTMIVGFKNITDNGNETTYYFNNEGIMVSGKWLEIEGNWYYLNKDGSLARDTKVDGYEIDEKGIRK
jgi:glucan-binding YG repeat protein